jgi:hypothetical protein
MAIAPVLLTTDSDNTDHASMAPYGTASVSPTGPVLLGLSFATDESPTLEPPLPQTITGCSLTWSHVANVYYKTAGLTMRAKLALYQGLGSPTTGLISISFNFVCVGVVWTVIDVVGADPAGVFVGGQIATNSGSTPAGTDMSATLPSGTPSASGDRCFSVLAGQNAVSSWTPRTNWTELSEKASGTPSQVLESQWRSSAFEQTGSGTNGTASSWPSGIIVGEMAIAPSGGGGGPSSHVMLGLTGVG